MQVSGIVVLFIVYPHGALAQGTCSAGFEQRKPTCISQQSNPASCNANCCELDDTKCFNYQGSISCATGKYWDAVTSAGTATAAGGANKNTDCCSAKAQCSATGVSCSAGYKLKGDLTGLYCASSATDAASCNTNCCVLDDTKCLNYQTSISCATGKYWDAATSAGTATTAANKNTNCCTAQALCSTGTCSAGYKKSQSLCSSSAASVMSCNAALLRARRHKVFQLSRFDQLCNWQVLGRRNICWHNHRSRRSEQEHRLLQC